MTLFSKDLNTFSEQRETEYGRETEVKRNRGRERRRKKKKRCEERQREQRDRGRKRAIKRENMNTHKQIRHEVFLCGRASE